MCVFGLMQMRMHKRSQQYHAVGDAYLGPAVCCWGRNTRPVTALDTHAHAGRHARARLAVSRWWVCPAWSACPAWTCAGQTRCWAACRPPRCAWGACHRRRAAAACRRQGAQAAQLRVTSMHCVARHRWGGCRRSRAARPQVRLGQRPGYRCERRAGAGGRCTARPYTCRDLFGTQRDPVGGPSSERDCVCKLCRERGQKGQVAKKIQAGLGAEGCVPSRGRWVDLGGPKKGGAAGGCC